MSEEEIRDITDRIQALRLAYHSDSISFDEYLSETTKLYNKLVELKKLGKQ
jgi:hypothetical protein